MAKIAQLHQNGVNLYPQTVDQAVAVVAKSKKLSTVLAELDAKDEALEALIAAAEAKITVLNGNSSTEGSVDKKIADAINEFSTAISDNGAIDTFKELVDYVAAHGSDFSALVGRMDTAESDIDNLEGRAGALESDNTTNKANIASNTSAIEVLNGKVGSSADESAAEGSLYARVAYLKAEIAAMGGDAGSISEQINKAIEANNTSVVTPISDRVAVIEGDYLKAADKTALQEGIDGVAGDLSDHAGNTEIHITAAERTAWNAKVDYTEVGTETYPDFAEIALS